MTSDNWVIAIITVILGLPCVILNWSGVILWLFKKKSSSLVPLIGGILLGICIYNTPFKFFWWAGLIIDPGVWTGAAGLPLLIIEFIKDKMKPKNPYLNLNMGLVKENFVIANREDVDMWAERGFKEIKNYPIFHYKPTESQLIMLGKPLTLKEFGIEKIKNSEIVDLSLLCGTYGMGGAGFFGLKLKGDFGVRWLIYSIWSAGDHVLFDDRIIECHSDFEDKYHPWISAKAESNYQKNVDEFKNMLLSLKIKDVELSDEELTIKLTDNFSNVHTIKTYKYSEKFPEQGGTEKKRQSFINGNMNDYLLVIYDKTELMV